MKSLFKLQGAAHFPLVSLQGNRASSRVEVGNSGFLSSFNRDLRVPIEFQQGIQASSCVEALNSAFLSSYKRAVKPPVEYRWGPWAFTRGATRESDLFSPCEGILGVLFESVQDNQELFKVEGNLSVLLTLARILEFLSSFSMRQASSGPARVTSGFLSG